MERALTVMHCRLHTLLATLVLALLTALAGTSAVRASLVEQVRDCAAIANPDARLRCYDRMAAGVDQTRTGGGWALERQVSSLGDTSRLDLRLKADEPVPLRRGEYIPVLDIRCSDGQLSVFVDTGMEVDLARVGRGGTKYYSATIRYDERQPLEVELRGSEGGRELYFEAPGETVQQLLDHRLLLFRFKPFSRSAVKTQFSLRGLQDVIGPLREACPGTQ